MTAKKEKGMRGLRNTMEIDAKEVIGKVEKIALGFGYQIRPSAGIAVKEYCRKAVKRGLIADSDEALTVTSALIAGGIRQADKSGSKMLKISDIDQGWYEELSAGPGNCPPYVCSKLSILERVFDLQDKFEEFKAFRVELDKLKSSK